MGIDLLDHIPPLFICLLQSWTLLKSIHASNNYPMQIRKRHNYVPKKQLKTRTSQSKIQLCVNHILQISENFKNQ